MVLESTTNATATIEDNFWSADKTALNILLDKLDQSNKTTIAIQDFFNQRARIEEEYGNQLLRLSELFANNVRHEDNFDIISNTTEMSARAHMDLSLNIKNLLELPLNDFLKDQNHIKLYMANQMKESQNMKILHGDNVKKTRCLYVNECQQVNPSNKDIEILDFEYQQAINLMQLNSPAWIHDWRESCKTFQSLESNRLDYLKAVMKTFSSMLACTYSVDDQTCDRLVSVMDDLNVAEEISKFVANHGTGSTIPEIPNYTKFKKLETMDLMNDNNHNGLLLQPKKLRTIKEIVIPNYHDEQLRSVNDQLKKIPNPWDNMSTKPKIDKELYPPQQYPLNPVYKSNRKLPSQSDPILNNFAFQQEGEKYTNHMKNKSTLVTPQEEKSYQQQYTEQPLNNHHFDEGVPPWSIKDETITDNRRRAIDEVKPTTSTSSTNKKSSLLFFSPLNFLKKKKVVSIDEPSPRSNNKKRLSLGYISTTTTTTKKSTEITNQPTPSSPVKKCNNSSTTLLMTTSPTSPMFSQMDFYYSPSNSDIKLTQ